MKKILLVLFLVINACAVQRPMPPVIELIVPETANPFSQQGYYSVSSYNMSNIRLTWDVTETGANAVDVIIAKNDGSNKCKKENIVSTRRIFEANSQNFSQIPGSYITNNLAQMFESELSKFTAGRYAVCIAAVKNTYASTPSLPAFFELMSNQ